jgi:hypothetical protein
MSDIVEWVKAQVELNQAQAALNHAHGESWKKQLEVDEHVLRVLEQTRFLIGFLFGAVIALTVWSVLR